LLTFICSEDGLLLQQPTGRSSAAQAQPRMPPPAPHQAPPLLAGRLSRWPMPASLSGRAPPFRAAAVHCRRALGRRALCAVLTVVKCEI